MNENKYKKQKLTIQMFLQNQNQFPRGWAA